MPDIKITVEQELPGSKQIHEFCRQLKAIPEFNLLNEKNLNRFVTIDTVRFLTLISGEEAFFFFWLLHYQKPDPGFYVGASANVFIKSDDTYQVILGNLAQTSHAETKYYFPSATATLRFLYGINKFLLFEPHVLEIIAEQKTIIEAIAKQLAKTPAPDLAQQLLQKSEEACERATLLAADSQTYLPGCCDHLRQNIDEALYEVYALVKNLRTSITQIASATPSQAPSELRKFGPQTLSEADENRLNPQL